MTALGATGFLGMKLLFPDQIKAQPPASTDQDEPLQLKSFSFDVITVDASGKEKSRRSNQATCVQEDLGKGVILEMVKIPGGSFLMGSPTAEQGRYSPESQQHRVTIPDFFIGRYPVTQAQYEAIVNKNPSNFKGANRPVEKVTWNDAQAFCGKLSQKTGHNYRLPSEAEWEYACRAGTTTPFHFGETITTDLANYQGTDWEYQGTTYPGNYGNAPKGKYREQTTDVGSFPANAFGLCDMHGNVWEWCEDVYHENYQGAPTNGSAWNEGGEQGRRILRGGSWNSLPGICRSANRVGSSSDFLNSNFGFRVVAVLA
ncbi:MAG: formylglycine-generating enzyme family protein [Oculatellaceae cyanobacterium Prado106]|jgi:formylglycine-generating enzyme required for sulfatase activity|nr:formylglycine-generating enzyme family protein [Oculatellaceae cyanobacterium Prado106]